MSTAIGQMQPRLHNHTGLPEQVMPLIYDCVGNDMFDSRVETLKAIALNYLLLRKKPTRIVFHSVSSVLGMASDQGIHDERLTKFLEELDKLTA